MIGDSSRPYYPAFLDLKGHLAVVIGGGPSAERAVLGLLRYQADIIIIAPAITPALDALVAEGLLDHEARDYIRGDLAGATVAISASLSVEVNRAIYKEAEGSGCLVSVLEDPALCNFITPAVVQRGPFQLAISTAGAAPEVARAVRRDLEGHYGPEWETYVSLLAEVRQMVYARVPDPEHECEIIFSSIAESDVRERIVAGVPISAEDVFREFVFEDGPLPPLEDNDPSQSEQA
jgi:precorrin-2 dehydrogenase/sirohydrochlorin ferrochelatase